ncbi:DUF4286 family protein [Owenweeksia hongkongensis]|uniref:DUF4286 family protein n=1 Tax=Owenweeksia hongkongensis TaxID=253245 RepID=UPI003A8F11EA
MYIYNVTVNIDKSVHDEWLAWMKDTHIPDVMSTGMFVSNRILHVMVEEEAGITYSIQYEVKDMETLKLYHEMYAPKLQAEHTEKFKDKFVAFRTILRVEHNHKPE